MFEDAQETTGKKRMYVRMCIQLHVQVYIHMKQICSYIAIYVHSLLP